MEVWRNFDQGKAFATLFKLEAAAKLKKHIKE